MRNAIKFVSLIMALVLAFSLASCTLTKTYSYRNEDVELPIGVYIYQLYAAYQQAQSYAQKSDLYDSETEKYDGKDSFLGIEITDDDEKTATADQWIKDNVEKSMKDLLAYYHEFNRLGSTIDEATLEGYKSQAKEYWDYGPYYAQYGEQYKNPYSSIFEPIGVSFDSFYQATFYSSAMAEQIFKDLYGATGEQAVSDDELTKFFTENYTSYKYFSANLYETVEKAAEDENSETTTEDVALSDEEIKNYKDSFQKYADKINDGGSYDDAVASYMSDFGVETDPTTAGVEVLEDSSLGEDLINAYNEMKDGEAKYITVGEGNTAVIYFLYKAPIKDEVESQIGDETNRAAVLQKYKSDDYKDYIEEVANSLKYEVSSECKTYTPEKMEKIIKEQTKNSKSS